MTKGYSRREALHFAGAAAAALAGGGLLAGCSDSGNDSDPQRARFVEPFLDPSSWWLSQNYRPVDTERDVLNLKVKGAIPPELDGVYIRNGPNPVSGESGHWFMGEGMLHGIRIRGGAAEWYRNRYVQTDLLTAPGGGGIAPPSVDSHPANTAIAVHGDKIYATAETGLPFVIDRELATHGSHNYEGRLTTPMTAHPKLDPRTGELLFFGYGFIGAHLTYHQVSPAGELVRSEVIDMPAFSMMHDFALTEHYVIFIDVPIGFAFDQLSTGFPLSWVDDHPTRIGIMPRDGGSDDVIWIEIEQCMIVHTLNAFETADGGIVVICARMPDLWRGGARNWETGSLWRYTIDLASRSIAEEQLDDRYCDFPQFDRRLLGTKNRFGYVAHFGIERPGKVLRGVNGLLKYELDAGTSQLLELPNGEASDEVYFVPAAGATSEDHGYLIGFGHDAFTDTSHLAIYDAQAMRRLAVIEVPVRVPAGFHGMWIDAAAG